MDDGKGTQTVEQMLTVFRDYEATEHNLKEETYYFLG